MDRREGNIYRLIGEDCGGAEHHQEIDCHHNLGREVGTWVVFYYLLETYFQDCVDVFNDPGYGVECDIARVRTISQSKYVGPSDLSYLNIRLALSLNSWENSSFRSPKCLT